MEHLVQYILLLTPYQTGGNSDTYFGDQLDEYSNGNTDSNSLLEERNNVAHAMHVVFATYRQFAYPWQLFGEIIRQKPFASAKQFNFILYYWLNNYPEDFWTPCQPKGNPSTELDNGGGPRKDSPCSPSVSTEHDTESLYSEYTSSSSSSQYQDYTTGSSSMCSTLGSSSEHFSPLTLADQLISMRHIDEEVKKHCLHLLDMKKENTFTNRTLTYSTHVSTKGVELLQGIVASIDLKQHGYIQPDTEFSANRATMQAS